MANSAKYKCPVCKKPLTKNEFERALKIHEAQEKHFEHKEREFAKKVRRFDAEKKQIKKAARDSERARTRRMVGGKVKEIGKLRDRIKMLQRGKTPQEGGPAFEIKLVKQLQAEFDGDDVQHKGQAGDVLHIVKEGSKIAGIIIYECKWTPSISGSHIRQTAQAKMSRHAQFAVLVTSGTRRDSVD
jgi:predicted RNase H-like nuclease (RuvC/YqgF family)